MSKITKQELSGFKFIQQNIQKAVVAVVVLFSPLKDKETESSRRLTANNRSLQRETTGPRTQASLLEEGWGLSLPSNCQ